MVLLSPVNLSEGRSREILGALVATAGRDLLDVHADADHHRSVLTLVGEDAPRRVATVAVERIDLREHAGAHPRFGAVDVVPFVPWTDTTMDEAVRARAAFLRWAALTLALPGFAYGEDAPSLPEIRRRAFRDLAPDTGPERPHATAGAVAVGARGPLVAYNVWLAEPDLAAARQVAAEVRSDRVRALGLQVGPRVQVSMNLVVPTAFGPADAFDAVAARVSVAGAELVGLLGAAVLEAIPAERWAALDLSVEQTVEWRLRRRAAGAYR